MHEKLIPVVSIVGPTASGKTDLSVELSKMFNGEIVSADSMQIYKEFKVSTAKPDFKQLSEVKHYLIDELSVLEEYSVAEFVKRAQSYILDINGRGRLAFVVGGTGLYMDSLLKNINFENGCGKNFVSEDKFHDLNGDDLYAALKKVDPKSASEIHPNNKKRIARALSFYYSFGYPISVQKERSLNSVSPYAVYKIGINFRNRQTLYNRINLRVEKMFEDGIVSEAKKILEMNLSKTASGAIGCKELKDYVFGEISLEEAKNRLKTATRRYAKRQLTWFRRDEEINWIYADDFDNFSKVLESCKDMLKKFLKKINQ